LNAVAGLGRIGYAVIHIPPRRHVGRVGDREAKDRFPGRHPVGDVHVDKGVGMLLAPKWATGRVLTNSYARDGRPETREHGQGGSGVGGSAHFEVGSRLYVKVELLSGKDCELGSRSRLARIYTIAALPTGGMPPYSTKLRPWSPNMF
jgi:hypothetical protein